MPEPDLLPQTHRSSRNAKIDFRGQKRLNATHLSTTDPDARLYRKSAGAGSVLCFMGHTLMENRLGLDVRGDLTRANGHAERRPALGTIHDRFPGTKRRLTLAAFTNKQMAPSRSTNESLLDAKIVPEVALKCLRQATHLNRRRPERS